MESALHIDNHMENTQDEILRTAFQRFRIYGYNKTTMAEIAEDGDMSAANLYRYFDNKESLAKACINLHIEERIDRIHIAIRQPGLTASNKLRALTMTSLEHCHSIYSQEYHLNHLIQQITTKYPEVVHEKIRHIEYAIASVLSEGIENEEFHDVDIESTARAIYSAISSFDIPYAMSYMTLEEFRKRALEVIDLILMALHRCEK